jgi:hypothetical protein
MCHTFACVYIKALLAFSGDDGDGKLQAKEILACAQQVGDDLDPSKVNMEWANTLVAGVLGMDTNDPGDRGIDLFHFMDIILQMRKSMKVDSKSIVRKVLKLKERQASGGAAANSNYGNKEEDDDDDSDEDCDERENTKWQFPVQIPAGAYPATILSVPLPGGELNFVKVEEHQRAGDVVHVPMNDIVVNACVKQAVQAAANGHTISSAARFDGAAAGSGGGGGGGGVATDASSSGSASLLLPPLKGAPPYERGMGAEYASMKGRQRFCLNAFLALREAASLASDLPPMEGWMLKRGDAMSIGYLNSWKLRYFRLEGNELVYYTKEPDERLASESFTNPNQNNTNNNGNGGGEQAAAVGPKVDYVQQVREKAALEGREPTEKELSKALVDSQNEMVFDNDNCKG